MSALGRKADIESTLLEGAPSLLPGYASLLLSDDFPVLLSRENAPRTAEELAFCA
jgi:hypothetical protein